MNTKNNTAPYIKINNLEIVVSQEIRDEWNKFRDDVWHTAHKTGSCMCPSFRICCGDCCTCRWKQQGLIMSYEDNTIYESALYKNANCSSEKTGEGADPSDIAVIEDQLERIRNHANELCKGGGIIFQMHYEQFSTYEISAATGIPQKTVYRRLQKILADLRNNWEKFQ